MEGSIYRICIYYFELFTIIEYKAKSIKNKISLSIFFKSLGYFDVLCLVSMHFHGSWFHNASSEYAVVSLFHQMIRLSHLWYFLSDFLFRWNILTILISLFTYLRPFSNFSFFGFSQSLLLFFFLFLNFLQSLFLFFL